MYRARDGRNLVIMTRVNEDCEVYEVLGPGRHRYVGRMTVWKFKAMLVHRG